jgi:hypothetical protein
MWSHWVDSNPGCEDQRLNFSEALELLGTLSGSRAPGDLALSKHVYMGGGAPSDPKGSQIVKSVRAWASVLPLRLADPFTKWGVLLMSLEARRRSSGLVVSGRVGEVVGAVEVLILSTSKPDVPMFT